MAITVDVRTPGNQTAGGMATATSVSMTHTINSISNGILIAVVQNDGGADPTSVNWDTAGVNEALTKKGTVSQGSTRATIWYKKNPTAGASKTLQANFGASVHGIISAASYAGVDQSTTFNAASPQTNTGASGGASLAITSANGELVIDSAVWDLAGNTNIAPTKVSGSQNYIGASIHTVDNAISGSGSDQASTGASVTLQWTADDLPDSAWGQVGISLIPATGGTTLTPDQGTASFTGQAPILACAILMPDEL